MKKVQIDKNPKHIGRRTALDLGLVGDIKSTVSALLPAVKEKTDGAFLAKQLAHKESFHELLQHYVEKGPGIKPIRPEFLAATLSELASDDAMFFADTGTACIWVARHIYGGKNRRLFGSSRGHLWPTLHRTRLDVPWLIPEDSALRYAAMEASRCLVTRVRSEGRIHRTFQSHPRL